MITVRAKASFDRLLQASLRATLPATDGPLVIECVTTPDKMKENKVVILTVSSYHFRLIATLYFKSDAETRAYFNRGGGDDAAPLTEDEFLDRVAECGNVFCGALNRNLGKHFAHLGMSTPNIIDKDCMRYVDLLECELVRYYKLQLSNELAMYASLCVAAYGDIDFHAEEIVEEDVSIGELEMF